METERRTKAKIRFIDFIRPDYFPNDYTIEQAFELFRWMVKTGRAFTEYGFSGPFDLLNKKPTCINSNIDPIQSIQDLRTRINYALLSAGASTRAKAWLEKERISVNETRWLTFPHYTPFTGGLDCEANIRKALTELLEGSAGKPLNVSLNHCWPLARTVQNVDVRVDGRFRFVMTYGFKDDLSCWDYCLAATKGDETFTDTLYRAIEELKRMTAPIKQRLPKVDTPVLCRLRHCDTSMVRDVRLVRVEEDDCSWRMADDLSEISYGWDIIQWHDGKEWVDLANKTLGPEK